MAIPRNLANIAPAMNGSGGKVTIGGSTPLGTFNLVGLTRPSGVVTYTSAASVSNAQAGLNWYQDNNTNYEYYLDLFATATSESPWGGSNIRMLTTPVGSATAVERARITRTGNMLVGTTTNNASGGVLQISNGITFPATQSASSDANTLDDYEEGTWTPTDASGAGLSLTVSGTSTYTKIGRVVNACCHVAYPSTSNTSNATIGGLPFTVANTGSINMQGGIIANTNRGIAIYVMAIQGDTRVAFTDVSDTNQTNANMSTKTIRFTAVYIV